jgi:hypothetical protein
VGGAGNAAKKATESNRKILKNSFLCSDNLLEQLLAYNIDLNGIHIII